MRRTFRRGCSVGSFARLQAGARIAGQLPALRRGSSVGSSNFYQNSRKILLRVFASDPESRVRERSSTTSASSTVIQQGQCRATSASSTVIQQRSVLCRFGVLSKTLQRSVCTVCAPRTSCALRTSCAKRTSRDRPMAINQKCVPAGGGIPGFPLRIAIIEKNAVRMFRCPMSCMTSFLFRMIRLFRMP